MWLTEAASTEEVHIQELNYIACSDEHLLKINVEFLNHDYYTDIITFDYSEVKREIKGDVFISLDRVQENSLRFKTGLDLETYRVIIHGLLHLIGYNDRSEQEKSLMTQKEDYYLSLLPK